MIAKSGTVIITKEKIVFSEFEFQPPVKDHCYAEAIRWLAKRLLGESDLLAEIARLQYGKEAQ